MAKPVLFVLSAPSGAGKSTLIHRVRISLPDLFYSVSCTTRPPRKGEADSVDYHFINRDLFIQMIERGDFLEWKEVHGSLYGTPIQPIQSALRGGRRCIMDIDVKGATDVFSRIKESIGIFIMPPDLQTLENRLIQRGADSEDSIRLRLQNAREEIEFATLFSYKIVNDNLDRAVRDLIDIILLESCPMDKP
ncbi:MAG: guanylate kinase [Deltaproteobacteria bacterium]|nr:guanylate kinase [Deltaproteobacteria bacterium]